MKSLIRYFIQGLLVIVPLAVTGFVLYKFFSWVLRLFTGFDVLIHPYADPLIILCIVVVGIVLIGMFASSWIANILLRATEKVLENTPVVKLIYSPIKDILSAFIGNRKRFNKPVLITLNAQNEIHELGFITQEDLTELGLGKELIAVYIPASYAVSGRVLLVPRSRIRTLDIPAADAMKFILSGGVTDLH